MLMSCMCHGANKNCIKIIYSRMCVCVLNKLKAISKIICSLCNYMLSLFIITFIFIFVNEKYPIISRRVIRCRCIGADYRRVLTTKAGEPLRFFQASRGTENLKAAARRSISLLSISHTRYFIRTWSERKGELCP